MYIIIISNIIKHNQSDYIKNFSLYCNYPNQRISHFFPDHVRFPGSMVHQVRPRCNMSGAGLWMRPDAGAVNTKISLGLWRFPPQKYIYYKSYQIYGISILVYQYISSSLKIPLRKGRAYLLYPACSLYQNAPSPRGYCHDFLYPVHSG